MGLQPRGRGHDLHVRPTPVGSSPDIAVVVTAPSSRGTIANTAIVAASSTLDPNTADNTATITTSVDHRVYLPSVMEAYAL